VQRACIFCNSPLSGIRSQEHVFPQWLLDELEIRNVSISPTHFKPDGTVVSTRSHPVDSLREGRVCRPCNTGWMSNLEQQAQPLLSVLFTGARTVVELSSKERAILAKWTAKTAFVLNSASNYRKSVPAVHLSSCRVAEVVLPDLVATFAQQHHGTEPFGWIQQPGWQAYTKAGKLQARIDDLARTSYKISLQFGKLLLLVAYWPHDGWRFLIWKGIHVPLWPQSGPCGWYHKEMFPWFDSRQALAYFHLGLMVAETSGH
jgi:hypothetical protein